MRQIMQTPYIQVLELGGQKRLMFQTRHTKLKRQDPAFLAIGGAVASFTMVAQLFMIQV